MTHHDEQAWDAFSPFVLCCARRDQTSLRISITNPTSFRLFWLSQWRTFWFVPGRESPASDTPSEALQTPVRLREALAVNSGSGLQVFKSYPRNR
jgi:hypothetical protein